ncbi:MAG: hypothetical protein WCA08_02400 [Desulfoferrobacter sp.]
MNKKALTKHDIYSKLIGFSEQDLSVIAGFIDSMRQNKQLESKKLLKLEGILKGSDIDFSELKEFREQTWQHVEQEADNG